MPSSLYENRTTESEQDPQNLLALRAFYHMAMIDVCLLTFGTHPFDQMVSGATMEGQSSECQGIVPSLSFLPT